MPSSVHDKVWKAEIEEFYEASWKKRPQQKTPNPSIGQPIGQSTSTKNQDVVNKDAHRERCHELEKSRDQNSSFFSAGSVEGEKNEEGDDLEEENYLSDRDDSEGENSDRDGEEEGSDRDDEDSEDYDDTENDDDSDGSYFDSEDDFVNMGGPNPFPKTDTELFAKVLGRLGVVDDGPPLGKTDVRGGDGDIAENGSSAAASDAADSSGGDGLGDSKKEKQEDTKKASKSKKEKVEEPESESASHIALKGTKFLSDLANNAHTQSLDDHDYRVLCEGRFIERIAEILLEARNGEDGENGIAGVRENEKGKRDMGKNGSKKGKGKKGKNGENQNLEASLFEDVLFKKLFGEEAAKAAAKNIFDRSSSYTELLSIILPQYTPWDDPPPGRGYYFGDLPTLADICRFYPQYFRVEDGRSVDKQGKQGGKEGGSSKRSNSKITLLARGERQISQDYCFPRFATVSKRIGLFSSDPAATAYAFHVNVFLGEFGESPAAFLANQLLRWRSSWIKKLSIEIVVDVHGFLEEGERSIKGQGKKGGKKGKNGTPTTQAAVSWTKAKVKAVRDKISKQLTNVLVLLCEEDDVCDNLVSLNVRQNQTAAPNNSIRNARNVTLSEQYKESELLFIDVISDETFDLLFPAFPVMRETEKNTSDRLRQGTTRKFSSRKVPYPVFPQLRCLAIECGVLINDAKFEAILDNCPGLRELYLPGPSDFRESSDESFRLMLNPALDKDDSKNTGLTAYSLGLLCEQFLPGMGGNREEALQSVGRLKWFAYAKEILDQYQREGAILLHGDDEKKVDVFEIDLAGTAVYPEDGNAFGDVEMDEESGVRKPVEPVTSGILEEGLCSCPTKYCTTTHSYRRMDGRQISVKKWLPKAFRRKQKLLEGTLQMFNHKVVAAFGRRKKKRTVIRDDDDGEDDYPCSDIPVDQNTAQRYVDALNVAEAFGMSSGTSTSLTSSSKEAKMTSRSNTSFANLAVEDSGFLSLSHNIAMFSLISPTLLRVPHLQRLVLRNHNQIWEGRAGGELQNVRPWLKWRNQPDGSLEDHHIEALLRRVEGGRRGGGGIRGRRLGLGGGLGGGFRGGLDSESDYYGSDYGGYSDSDDSDYFGGYGGFSRSDCEELMMQGVKPWDDDAGDVLAVLNGYY